MKTYGFIFALQLAFACSGSVFAALHYHSPPPEVLAILDAPAPPGGQISPDRQWLVITERDLARVSIAELAEPHLELAGKRFKKYPESRIENEGIFRLTLRRIDGTLERVIEPPAGGRIRTVAFVPRSARGGELAYTVVENGAMSVRLYDANTGVGRTVRAPGLEGSIGSLSFTLDGRYLAFTAATRERVAIWIADTVSAQARRAEGVELNHVNGGYGWTRGQPPLLVRAVPPGRGAPPVADEVPTGPIVQESFGRVAQGRTFQNLLQSPQDEALYDYYFTNQLMLVNVDGRAQAIGAPGIHSVSPSPDGQYLFVRSITRPYSYQVPETRFPTTLAVWSMAGKLVRELHRSPLQENIPSARDAVLPEPRAFSWRPDVPATLTWVEPLDGGDPSRDVPKRDRLVMLDAPFTGAAKNFFETEMRLSGVMWALDDAVFVSETSSRTSRTRTWIINPLDRTAAPRVLWDRNREDRYSSPGSFVMTDHPTEPRSIPLQAADGSLYLSGEGAAPGGARPFLDRLDLRTLATTRLWQSTPPLFESVAAVLDAEAKQVVISRESPTQRPNLFLARGAGEPIQLTDLPEPAPWFAEVKGEQVRYKRADGVQLSATLYLPPGYDQERDGPLPFLFWAYPREFMTEEGASQVAGSPLQFRRPGRQDHLLLLARGYGILDNPAMPIVGRDGREPNDTYVEQLVAGAQAAVDYLVQRGIGDRNRMAVGGHSYGAFMTANLLAHTDLFRTGIARSGAYNRTLTPFGFQAEPRTYWQAPETYHEMSPFTHVAKIKEPILLIHGMRDPNPGTFPIQTERFFAALKGNGGNVRYVQLPLEEHGYRARESRHHVLWEMITWLDQHMTP